MMLSLSYTDFTVMPPASSRWAQRPFGRSMWRFARLAGGELLSAICFLAHSGNWPTLNLQQTTLLSYNKPAFLWTTSTSWHLQSCNWTDANESFKWGQHSFLCFLNKYHIINVYWESRGIAPHILDHGTRWGWVVSFTSRMLYPLVPIG